MNRISKTVYTQKFREEAVKLAISKCRSVRGRTSIVYFDEDPAELGPCRKGRQAGKCRQLLASTAMTSGCIDIARSQASAENP